MIPLSSLKPGDVVAMDPAFRSQLAKKAKVTRVLERCIEVIDAHGNLSKLRANAQGVIRGCDAWSEKHDIAVEREGLRERMADHMRNLSVTSYSGDREIRYGPQGSARCLTTNEIHRLLAVLDSIGRGEPCE